MDAKRQPKSTKTLLVYGGLLLGSIIAMMAGYFLEDESKFAGHLLRDIGISGIVGFILAMTFEQLSTAEFRRLTKEEREAIKKDVFYYVLGYDIPQAIRDEINTQILKSLFIREDFIMDYDLKIIKDADGESYMRTICTLSYNIRNLTNDPQTFRLNAAIDKSPVASLAHEAKFKSLSVSGSGVPFSYNEEQLQAIKEENDTEISLTKKFVVLHEQMTKVEISNQTVRFLKRGHLDFVFTNHTCDLDLTVRVHDPHVKVFASSNGSLELKETHRHHPSSNYYNWTIDRPLLAYQGINITWLIEQPATSGTTTNQAGQPVVTTAPADNLKKNS